MSKPVCPKCKGNNAAVIDRMCNYSAFNGYHCTASDYSGVVCTDCGWPWRTKAKYVHNLKDSTYQEVDAAIKARAALAHVEVPALRDELQDTLRSSSSV